MAAAEIDIKYVAHLARLHLTPDEEKKLAAQLGGILGYIEKLKELDVAGVEPTPCRWSMSRARTKSARRSRMKTRSATRPRRPTGFLWCRKLWNNL
jgi:aspartyl/glutamyl-tRNA(Asn/Gln) amidotransferase C subunit